MLCGRLSFIPREKEKICSKNEMLTKMARAKLVEISAGK